MIDFIGFGGDIMAEVYYQYEGKVSECEIGFFILELIDKSIWDYGSYSYIFPEEVNKILSGSEKLEVKISHVIGASPKVHFPPFILSRINVNINIKATTVTLLAILLDINLTNGFASGILALSGFNSRAFVKLNEYDAEKCILLEICSNGTYQVEIGFFNNICNKECVNNHIHCRYRTEGMCTMKYEEVLKKCDNLVEKNVLKKDENFYSYIV